MKSFKTESKRILDLMINSIYTNKDIFLREIISNASDAIDKAKFISLTDGKAATDYEINISVDKAAKTLTVKDNGIGMTENELEKNLGTIAESGTFAFKKDNENKTDENLIGQFGVGFYSAFMVADKITVITKPLSGEQAFKWESCGAEGYEITPADKTDVGTEIIMKLKDDTDDVKYSEYLEDYKIAMLIKRYSDYIRYPITMEVVKSQKKAGSPDDKPEYEDVKVKETLNSMVPLWKKPKSEVKDDELNEFYKTEFHDFENPLKSVYAKIEGMVNYDTLLFIPSRAPYDYYSKDYKKGVKLYSNGVMIMEKCEDLLPDYFAFVRGVVDSSDLNLNISREILQQDRQVKAIATSLEKKISSELKKLMDEDADTYRKVFEQFGLSLKFGVYAGFGLNKDKLKDLLMFYSARKEKLISLKEYVDGMAEGQNEIFYACGDSYQKIAKLPQIERITENGYDVLYFKDGVDEFVAKILNDYGGKKFKSVTDADFSMQNENEKQELEKKQNDLKDVLEFIKQSLDGKVKDVKLSANLKTYPVCLSSAGDVSIEMEKVLNSMPNSDGKLVAEKNLELNSEHKIISRLKDLYDTDKEKLKKYALVLYEQARLAEGLNIDDVTAYIEAVSDVL